MRKFCIAFAVAVAAVVLAACASTDPASPSTVMQPASPVPPVVTLVPSSAAAEPPAVTAAREWAARWCGWDWREPAGAREARAREVMTPAAGGDLPVPDADTWRRDVVEAHEVATCAPATVRMADGPRSASRVHVSISAERTVRNDRGLSSAMWRDDRLVMLAGGRWLVDVAVAGG